MSFGSACGPPATVGDVQVQILRDRALPQSRARSFRQLGRFHHVSNSDKVFGTHGQRGWSNWPGESDPARSDAAPASYRQPKRPGPLLAPLRHADGLRKSPLSIEPSSRLPLHKCRDALFRPAPVQGFDTSPPGDQDAMHCADPDKVLLAARRLMVDRQWIFVNCATSSQLWRSGPSPMPPGSSM
jgi:hypothetical protein